MAYRRRARTSPLRPATVSERNALSSLARGPPQAQKKAAPKGRLPKIL